MKHFNEGKRKTKYNFVTYRQHNDSTSDSTSEMKSKERKQGNKMGKKMNGKKEKKKEKKVNTDFYLKNSYRMLWLMEVRK